jgi:pSer/pThr/pTyr-binding forkhead associated (FHA) protein
MSAIIVLILRFLMAVSLFAFLGWALYTIWNELRLTSELVSRKEIPQITVTTHDLAEDIIRTYNTQEIIIGRDTSCELTLSDDTVSARHARLSFHHKQWWLEDLHSTNGTFLNEERVTTPTVVISGDEIRCGKIGVTLEFTSTISTL